MKKINLIIIALISGMFLFSCNSSDDVEIFNSIAVVTYNDMMETTTIIDFGGLKVGTRDKIIGTTYKDPITGEPMQIEEGDLVQVIAETIGVGEPGASYSKLVRHIFSHPVPSGRIKTSGLDTLGTDKINNIATSYFIKNYLITVISLSERDKNQTISLAVDSVWDGNGEYNYLRNDSLFLNFRVKTSDVSQRADFSVVPIDIRGFSLPSELISKDSVTISFSYIDAYGDKKQYKPSKPIKFVANRY